MIYPKSQLEAFWLQVVEVLFVPSVKAQNERACELLNLLNMCAYFVVWQRRRSYVGVSSSTGR